MTAVTENAQSPRPWSVLNASEPQARISAVEADAAFRAIRGLSVQDARAKLTRGAGPTYEPVARVLDKALSRAEAVGIHTDQLVVVNGTAEPGPDLLREKRKLGTGTWFTIPTASLTVELQPAALQLRQTSTFPAVLESPPNLEQPAAPDHHDQDEHDERVVAVRTALCEVLDPDLGVNIVDLGFVRHITVDPSGVATLTMTLTSPVCPLTGIMEEQIRRVLVRAADSPVTDFHIEWSWQPAWKPSDITEEGRDQLRAIGFTNFF